MPVEIVHLNQHPLAMDLKKAHLVVDDVVIDYELEYPGLLIQVFPTGHPKGVQMTMQVHQEGAEYVEQQRLHQQGPWQVEVVKGWVAIHSNLVWVDAEPEAELQCSQCSHPNPRCKC